MQKLLEDFQRIFQGLDKAYGTYKIESIDPKTKKAKGKAQTHSEKVSEAHFRAHLEGRIGLGIIPIRQDSKAYWGAIDVDEYEDFSLSALEKKVRALGLPLIVCRTKSGGAHLYLFLRQALEAKFIRQKLLQFANTLGHFDCEIFPKQNTLSADSIGNWINLPYFNYKHTDRYAIKNGKRIVLVTFLKYVDDKRVSKKELSAIKLPGKTEVSDAPVCLQRLIVEGITIGKKNNCLFNLGVYCKRKYKEDWQKKLLELNEKFVKPPAQAATLRKVIAPLRKKDYFYTCENTPLKDFCDKDQCKKMDYGIGSKQKLDLGELQKIETDPPTWQLEIGSIRIELQTEELLSQEKFRKACMEKLMILPYKQKSDDWDNLIRDKLEKVEVIEAPPDAGPTGQFLRFVEDFTTTQAQARNRDELLMGKPWEQDGYVYFRSTDLLKYLEREKFREFKPRKIWAVLKSIGAVHDQIRVKGKGIRIWGLPAFDKQTEDFDVQQEDEGEF